MAVDNRYILTLFRFWSKYNDYFFMAAYYRYEFWIRYKTTKRNSGQPNL